MKQTYNLNTPADWNTISRNHVLANGGDNFLNKYSLYQLKCMACPEGKSIFNNNTSGYWKNKENINNFLLKLKEKYNFNTPEDWNLMNSKHIKSNGGSSIFKHYSIYDLKCMACP